MRKFKNWALQVLIALDQLANAIIGGWADETICARVYRNARKGYWYAILAEKILNCIFRILGDKSHCETAYNSELNRAHLSDVYQNK